MAKHRTSTETDQPARSAGPPTRDTNRSLLEQYDAVRERSRWFCETLEPEDCVIQPMTEASPTRWHLAHTTWFFENLALVKFQRDYRPFHPDFVYLFNSYYNTVGDQFPRPNRGLLSRPTVADVLAYRDYVDGHMRDWLDKERLASDSELAGIIKTGLNHEQQHQELMLTDIKNVFSCNPIFPVYRDVERSSADHAIPHRWVHFDEGLQWIGHEGDGFAYDNERPRHRVFLHAFDVASRLITNGEYMEFMNDGGYERHELWLSDGWNAVQEHEWKAPLYWYKREGRWYEFTLSGLRPIDLTEPVTHVSFFEADAFARWAGARLPLEAEWEIASRRGPDEGNFVDQERFHPAPARKNADAPGGGLSQMFGDVWEWTSSPYVAYPGYEPPPGAMGEYNGKFMCNQMVLRGGSCATSRSHVRRTYRNFWPPAVRFQFTGIRLARWKE